MKVLQPLMLVISISSALLTGCSGSDETNNTNTNTNNTDTTEPKSVTLHAFGESAYLIDANGDLWGWGDNAKGQLAEDPSTAAELSTPQLILHNAKRIITSKESDSNFAAIAIIKTDNSLWMWGENSRGNVGNDTTELTYTPTHILDNIAEVHLEDGPSTFARTKAGSWYAWGYNNYQQLSFVSQDTIVTTPTLAPQLNGFDNVHSSNYSSWAISDNNELYVWGANDSSQFPLISNSGESNRIETPTIMLSNIQTANISLSASTALTLTGNYFIWGLAYGDSFVPVNNNVKQALSIGSYSARNLHYILDNNNTLWTNVDFTNLDAPQNYALDNWIMMDNQVRSIQLTDNSSSGILLIHKQDNTVWAMNNVFTKQLVASNVANIDWQGNRTIFYYRDQEQTLHQVNFDDNGQFVDTATLSQVEDISTSDSLILVRTHDNRIWFKHANDNTDFTEVTFP